MNSQICIADADFLISIVWSEDVNHKNVLNILTKLNTDKAIVIHPESAIIEAATTLLRKYGRPDLANDLLNGYKSVNLSVGGVTSDEFINSIQYFDPNGSKQNTPFDCLILSIAKSHKAEVILSFDGWYINKGFQTAYDLL